MVPFTSVKFKVYHIYSDMSVEAQNDRIFPYGIWKLYLNMVIFLLLLNVGRHIPEKCGEMPFENRHQRSMGE